MIRILRDKFAVETEREIIEIEIVGIYEEI